jgi:hypothetical protein
MRLRLTPESMVSRDRNIKIRDRRVKKPINPIAKRMPPKRRRFWTSE